ncbi:MAG: TetR/AcrR family transcriptional regulator [Spirochaetaceae bacterium]|jgi:AcrR family transcriptional regulator|nr:TetR/AcrR family transcriptional regulator [Spirochaetaceae bacterium]
MSRTIENIESNEKLCGVLKSALDVFEEEGFENTTFQKIADRVNVTRTSLYQYFKNKLDVFHHCIKIFLKDIETTITALSADAGITSIEKLIRLMRIILECLEENRRLLNVILDFLTHSKISSEEMNYHIRRRTIRLRHIFAGIIIDGMNSGEMRRLDIGTVGGILFSLIQAAIFELVIFKRETILWMMPLFEANIRAFQTPK